ncbi:cell wall-associated NlpC family hydrolase [Trueperella bonasi]|uniref:Cell wall-associated NlpC family hydrolase n=1 Tax=Trueperella bonasi TaxID=312286 RepID=A0ABT9NFK9_9ACTO|nr:C40 family peptidase [Trueperella bonasi]MDP9806177.1 cell wall-associated NlpC family hydrolase [Trueperella bonasi]
MAGRHEMVKPRETFSKSTMTTAATASAAGMLMGIGAPIAFASPTEDQVEVEKVAAALESPAVETNEVASIELNTVSGGDWEMKQVVIEAEAPVAEQVVQQETAAQNGGYGQQAQGGASSDQGDAPAPAPAQQAPAASYSGSGSAVAGTALAYAGAPYRWGGTTPAGWDCIGFVRYVYAQHGVHIGGYTSSVLSVGRQVPYSQVQPGDILYWPGHVGISVGGGQHIGAWNPSMGTQVGSDYVIGTPVVIRVFG